VPTEQAGQVKNPLADAYDPDEHSVHADADATEVLVPSSQYRHIDEAVAPVVLRKVPARQSLHAIVPVSEAYLPVGHAKQAEEARMLEK
jgi:hypothetical protein